MEAVPWDNVEPIAEEAFQIWVGGGDRDWARAAWEALSRAGLTQAGTFLEEVTVYVRFLVVASFYRDWCAVAFDEWQDDEPAVWLTPASVSPFFIGQLVGDNLLPEDPEEVMDEALHYLMDRERPAVVKALVEGFGGKDLLFIALWKSGRPWPAADAGEDDDGDQPPRNDADIINDPTEEKLAAYQWLTQGCERLGPPRSEVEFDGGW